MFDQSQEGSGGAATEQSMGQMLAEAQVPARSKLGSWPDPEQEVMEPQLLVRSKWIPCLKCTARAIACIHVSCQAQPTQSPCIDLGPASDFAWSCANACLCVLHKTALVVQMHRA